MEIYVDAEDNFLDVLRRLSDRGVFTPQVREIFHGLRVGLLSDCMKPGGDDAVVVSSQAKCENAVFVKPV